MKAKTRNILNALNDAGQFNAVTWRRQLKTRKDFPGLVEKITRAVVSAGTDYANRKSVKEAIDAGERGEVQSLPWGVWLQFPHVIEHKGNEYIRFYPPSDAQTAAIKNFRMASEYFINGKPATPAECEPLCLASEFRKDDNAPDCLTVNADNILTVGGVKV